MDQTNTQTQAGQNSQNLQSVGSQAQQTANGFQGSSGVDLSTDNTSNVLNQGISLQNLSVGVASANTKTTTEPPKSPEVISSGMPASYVFVPLLILFVFALVLAYRRAKKFDERALKTSPAEVALLEEIKQVKNKKKKKKPKKPHHR